MFVLEYFSLEKSSNENNTLRKTKFLTEKTSKIAKFICNFKVRKDEGSNQSSFLPSAKHLFPEHAELDGSTVSSPGLQGENPPDAWHYNYF